MPDGTIVRCDECQWRCEEYFGTKLIEKESSQALAANWAWGQELLEARLRREAEEGSDVPAPRTPLLRELGRFWVRQMKGIALVSFELVRLVGAFFGDCTVEVESYEGPGSRSRIKLVEKGRVLAVRGDELLDRSMDYTVEITEFAQPSGLDVVPGARAVGPFVGPLGVAVLHLLFFLGSTGVSWVGDDDDYPDAVDGRIPKRDDEVSYWIHRVDGTGPSESPDKPTRIVRMPRSRGPLNDPHRLLRRLGVVPETADVKQLRGVVRRHVCEVELETFFYEDFHKDEHFLFEPNWTHFENLPMRKTVFFPSPLGPDVWKDYEPMDLNESPGEESGSSMRNDTMSSVMGTAGTSNTPLSTVSGDEEMGEGVDEGRGGEEEVQAEFSDSEMDPDDMDTDLDEP